MGLHHHGNQQIAVGAAVLAGMALTAQGNGLAVVDAGRDVDLHGLALACASAAVTVGTGLMDDFARPAALAADSLGLHHAKGRALRLRYRAAAVAVGADLRRCAGRTAAALTGGALLAALNGDLLLAAESRFNKVHRHAHANTLAPLRAIAPALTAAAKAAAEKAAENIAQIAEIKAACAISAACPVIGIHAGKAELVIARLLVGIGEHLVGLVDLLELLLGLLIAGVHVRMVLAGQLFIGSFDLVLGCAFGYAENLIIISFFLCHRYCS